jgi:hypothetical protein
MSRLKLSAAEVKAQMLANAAEINRLHRRIGETLVERSKSQEGRAMWEAACAEFHARYDDLAFPGGLSNVFAGVDLNDTVAISDALSFLEVRPYFFRSGYMHQRLMRKLKHKPLPPELAKRRDAYFKRHAEWRATKRSQHPSTTTTETP